VIPLVVSIAKRDPDPAILPLISVFPLLVAADIFKEIELVVEGSLLLEHFTKSPIATLKIRIFDVLFMVFYLFGCID
jgi:hypothetical protein